jgi:hypothetical protein
MGAEEGRRSVGLITIGQAPRVDMVPEMTIWLGPVPSTRLPHEFASLPFSSAATASALRPIMNSSGAPGRTRRILPASSSLARSSVVALSPATSKTAAQYASR